MLNDGSAIIGYNILLIVARGERGIGSLNPTVLVPEIALLFGVVCISAIFGVVVAWIAAYLMGKIRHTIRERGIIFVAVYSSWIVCEKIGGSGVIALVMLGVFLNKDKGRISEEATEDNEQTWNLLAYWANGTIFILAGILVVQSLWEYRCDQDSFHYLDYVYMLLIYVLIILIRFISLCPVYWIFPYLLSYPINWKYIFFLSWGGLRGAVALLLAMTLRYDPVINDTVVGARSLVYVAAVVLLSLVIEATTSIKIIKWFGLDIVSNYKRRMMEGILDRLDQLRYGFLSMLKTLC